jgi:hypothetical protein
LLLGVKFCILFARVGVHLVGRLVIFHIFRPPVLFLLSG